MRTNSSGLNQARNNNKWESAYVWMR